MVTFACHIGAMNACHVVFFVLQPLFGARRAPALLNANPPSAREPAGTSTALTATVSARTTTTLQVNGTCYGVNCLFQSF